MASRKPRKTRKLRLTAFHEAGHAVASHRGGFTTTIASIVPRPGQLGHESSLDGWHDEKAGGRYIVALLAGHAAEIKAGQRVSAADVGACGDFEQADHIIGLLGKGTRASWMRRARAFVGRPRNWARIERVAAELLRHGTLFGDELDLLINDGPEALETFRRNFMPEKARNPRR